MIRCENCGEENPERARFCLSCGTALNPATQAQHALRKTVTIVFADVTGSTALGERLDPESLRHLMSRYFEAARSVMERHGGTVEKFIGDAVMAVFGIPVLHEDDALRAVRAAADLRDAVATLSVELVKERGFEFAVRIGVNTGEVVVGDPSGSQTLVTGDAVNVAARLEQAAKPGEVLLGGPTHRLVRDAVTVEPIAAMTLKGKTDAVPAFRLVTVSAEGAGHARRLDAPLIGRQRELMLLAQAFERAVEENAAHLFTLLGPPGVGKSRLVNEFLTEHRERATVYEGRCLPYGDGITYWPMREVVRQAAEISDADAPMAATAKIRGLISGHERADRITEQIAGAIGLGEVAGTPEEVAWAFRKLMEARAAESPLILVIDDIQWAEPTFLDLLEHIADSSRAAPILLLCLARADLIDLRPSWGGGKLNATTILLEPLTADQSRQLVDALLGDAGIGPALADRVAAAAEGNPLFVEELLAMLVDDGIIQRTDDGWTVAGDLSNLLVPPTVSALLAARLDRLSESERDVIGRAAVVGKVFEEAAVAELSAANVRPSVQRNLLALVRKELIRPDHSSPDDDVYRFRHLLIRDAAYAALSKELRAELHAGFADWLVSAAGERSGEYDEIVAYHLEQAHLYRAELSPGSGEAEGLRQRAVELLTALGRRAYGRNDMRSAQSIILRALAIIAAGDPLRQELLLVLGDVRYVGGEFDDGERILTQAAELAAAHGNPSVAMRARMQLEYVRGMRDPAYDWGRLAALLDESQPVFEQTHDDAGLTRLWELRAAEYLIACHWGRASEAAERERAHAVAASDPQAIRRSEVNLCTAWYHGPTPVPEALAKIGAIMEQEPDSLRLAPVLIMLGNLHVMDGRAAEGVAEVRAGRAGLAELGIGLFAAATAMELGRALTLSGDLDGAIGEMREGAAALIRMGEKGMLSTLAGQLAVALARAGELDEAEAQARVAREATTAADVASQIVWRHALALVQAARGEHQPARGLATEALQFALETDDLSMQGDAFMVLADVLDVSGAGSEAGEMRRQALDRYERKGNRLRAAEVRKTLGLPPPAAQGQGPAEVGQFVEAAGSNGGSDPLAL
jgi:class 3 adenylate cyclase/tetratricopeptide (TPR) repeat protein